MQAEIPRIDERVVSLELVTPLGTSSSRVVSYGVFTAALLEGTDDTVDDFLAGSAYPEDVRKGKLKLHIHEGGRFHGLWLPARDEFAWWQVKARVTIPSDLEDATVEWVE